VSYPEAGRYSSVPPGRIGGNTDNKHLTVGTVIYLPVWVEGALLKTGDTHIAQGNGELTVSACEGAFDRFTLNITVRKDLKLNWPMASSKDNWIIMGFDLDLKEAARMASLKAIDFLVNYYGMDRVDAYMLASMNVDLEITQLGKHEVNHKKGSRVRPPGALCSSIRRSWADLFLPEKTAAFQFEIIDRIQDSRERIELLYTVGLYHSPAVDEPGAGRYFRNLKTSFRCRLFIGRSIRIPYPAPTGRRDEITWNPHGNSLL
jgi:hypothetical protein